MADGWLFKLFLLMLLPPLTFSVSDSEALLQLKKFFTNSSALNSWVPSSVPCNKQTPWGGLLCHNGVVQGLRLEGMGLSGSIDVDALVEIKGLRSLSVINNSFQGVIPQLNRLGALKALFLSGNQFSGEIPPHFFTNMKSLKKVWLSHNKFIGGIPFSLGQLPHLIELHLENNQFSGHIPSFDRPNLKSINLSNNRLGGEIPISLSNFSANSFAGNPGLCGKILGVNCTKPVQNTAKLVTNQKRVVGKSGKKLTPKIIVALITLGVMLVFVIILAAMRWMKKKKKKGPNGPTTSSEGAIEVQVSVPTAKEEEVNRKRSGSSSRKGSGLVKGGGGAAELVMVNDEKGSFGLTELMKAAAEVLGNGELGYCYKVTMANEVPVVVKRMRDMNALGKDEFHKQVKQFGNLRHPNILTPLAYHYRREEKLLVYQYLPNGCLLYQLHGEHDTSHVGLDWPARLKIVQGIAKGLDYLHTELASLDVPHGNLKSSNVLLGPDNHPFLSDYGFCSLVNTDRVEALFAYKTPDVIQHGNVSPKSDVYCLGIVILEILTGRFPSQYLNDGNRGTDVVQWAESAFAESRQAEMLDPEITSSQNSSLANMEKLLHIGLLCTQTSVETRLEIKEALRMIEEVKVEEGPPLDISIE
ncbi:pollen receptor-like kinase 3 [Gossypium raimondii]|uniref:Protein kinase domain-containing protein n=1 Tax=Gossypium raimondii TaxID=29730 RepID=A0A0D2VIV9_GOSRA|nr:pollen receptor-like kinase 3 [Gossypium raimondii]KJB70165.1 hypothetical protein B456_011G061900 [Gossypium raimondii]